MRIGLLFPGQGSQSLGMGKDIYNDYETYRNIVKKVNEYTGLNLEEITFNSSEEILNQTKNTQIAILTMSLGILEILKENKIIDNVYYSSIYNDYNVKKELEVLLVHDEKIIILNTNLNNVIENECFLNIYITISNLMKRISIPHIKFNYIKKKFINNFLSYIN